MKRKLEKKQKIWIIIIAFLVTILLLFLIVDISRKKETNSSLPYEMTSVYEILEYYKCKNINITNSSEDHFKTDIYLEFGEDLWEDDRANQSYYNGIITYITPILKYENYRLIDNSRELVIAIQTNKNEKKVDAVYINGQANYFAKERAKQVAGTFKKIDSVNLQVQSRQLQTLINNEWKMLGTSLRNCRKQI